MKEKPKKVVLRRYCSKCRAELKMVEMKKLFYGVVCKICKTRNYYDGR
jgi:hypothetical protein